MIKLIKIEWSKLKSFNTFRALIILYLVVVPLMDIGLASIDLSFLAAIVPNFNIFAFPTIYSLTAWLASCFNLLMSVIVISIAANEFTFKTFRQNLIDGLSKRDLIISKLLVILLISIFITVYTCLVAALMGLYFSNASEILEGINFIGIYFIQTIGYFSLAFLFAVLFKKSSLAIIVFILTILFDGVTFGFMMPKSAFVFFPTEVFSKLTPFPFMEKVIEKAKNGGEEIIQLDTSIGVVLALFYSAVFLFIAYKILQKKDI